jgi:hypothetical protein
MPRFFFNLRVGTALVDQDSEGQELASFEEARSEAIESARELLATKAESGEAASLDEQVEVVDEAGRTVITIPVGHVVGSPAQS